MLARCLSLADRPFLPGTDFACLSLFLDVGENEEEEIPVQNINSSVFRKVNASLDVLL